MQKNRDNLKIIIFYKYYIIYFLHFIILFIIRIKLIVILNIIYDIRNCVTQKIYLIIEFIFNEDIKSFNVGFGIQPDKKNEDFEELINIKNELINYKEIIQLPEEIVEKFCQKLINIPHLVAQISKIIDAKK